jgi:hypothetical protein
MEDCLCEDCDFETCHCKDCGLFSICLERGCAEDIAEPPPENKG